jgi:hypothetical protein
VRRGPRLQTKSYLSQQGFGASSPPARYRGEWRRRETVHRRPGSEELLRAKPNHLGLGQENHHHGAVRDQQSSRRRTARAGASALNVIARSAGPTTTRQSEEGRSSRRRQRRHPTDQRTDRPHQVLLSADVTMYRAKSGGGNRMETNTPQQKRPHTARLGSELDRPSPKMSW